MKTRVTKIMHFEMAHQLDQCYSDECKNIHGHSYKLEVTFEGPIFPATGMVMDFKLIKELVKPIVDRYDHSFQTSETYGKNPTAENMAKDIFEEIRANSPLIRSVRLWETADACATVTY